ncbi:hypothetical protein [Carboxylicivirga sp. N1Y90]|uniref:hypothetical protein n=1 Tax=Carboxylicivirga fragile TaxID=3417571 RepID=UPI003D3378EE|nr:hypothetical protein [Marinilabiliaceae bacterium N1Y90]
MPRRRRGGIRKLHAAKEEALVIENMKVIRDYLFDTLRNSNMLVSKKRVFAKPTNSYLYFHKYNNLIKDMKVTRPNQVWVSDITDIHTVNSFAI